MINLLVIRRKIIRQLLKFLGFDNYKIKSEYWPWIRILPSSSNHHAIYSFSKKIAQSIPVQEINCESKEFSIVGSGPSIKDIDFSQLKNTNIILLNGAISLIEKDIFPFCCVIIDSTFIENRFDIVKKLPAGTRLLTTLGCLRAINERDSSLIEKLIITVTQNVTSPIYATYPTGKEIIFQEQGYSDNIDIGYVDGGTVMAVGIQLALQLSARKIYLLGFDISNINQPRFYEDNGKIQKSGLEKDFENKILPFVKKIKWICTQRKISIFNCSSISKLPYEIIPFTDVMKKNQHDNNKLI